MMGGVSRSHTRLVALLPPCRFCSQPISVDVDRETAFLALSPTVLNLFDDASDCT